MAAVCWAAEALLVRMAGDRVDPLIGTAYSCVAAGIMFSAYLALTGRLGVGELNMSAAYYVLAGVISFAVGHYFYYASITRSGVSLSVSLAASYPLLAMLASVILFKEPVSQDGGWRSPHHPGRHGPTNMMSEGQIVGDVS